MPLPGPHVELTDPENERFLGTLTHRAWHLLNARHQRSKFFKPEFYDLDQITCDNHKEGCPSKCPKLVSSLRDLLSLSPGLFHDAIQTSGSIRGEHRRDLKDAIIGAPHVAAGYAVQDPEREEQKAAARKRGL